MAHEHYHPVSRYIHWLMAAIFIIAWAIGFYSTEFMTYGVDANKGSVITLHKNIASTILFLVVIRIFWRYTHPAPKLPDTMSAGMKKMAHLAHYVLYFLTRCAFRIKKSKLITYHNDIIQFSPKNQNNE